MHPTDLKARLTPIAISPNRAPTPRMSNKLEADIAWHEAQIVRFQEAIALGEPAKSTAAPAPAWGPKRGGAMEMPTTLAGMRQQLQRLEQTLSELEEQRGRGD